MDIKQLVKVTAKGWSLSILSHLHAGITARQAPLLAACGASRTAFAQSLNHLLDIGLLDRNPGHGHPLRPEYRLTATGATAAALAHRIMQTTPQTPTLLRRHWTVPVLAALHTPRRFNEIKRVLPAITDRALSQSLKSMEQSNWVQRKIVDSARPPSSLYSAINTGNRISQVLSTQLSPL